MPIFDFACDECGHEFEKLLLKSDAPAPECISCKGEKVTRQVSAPAFRLGGSGWYETDFKTGKKKNLASTGSENNSGGSTSDKAGTSKSSGSAASGSNASANKASSATANSD